MGVTVAGRTVSEAETLVLYPSSFSRAAMAFLTHNLCVQSGQGKSRRVVRKEAGRFPRNSRVAAGAVSSQLPSVHILVAGCTLL